MLRSPKIVINSLIIYVLKNKIKKRKNILRADIDEQYDIVAISL